MVANPVVASMITLSVPDSLLNQNETNDVITIRLAGYQSEPINNQSIARTIFDKLIASNYLKISKTSTNSLKPMDLFVRKTHKSESFKCLIIFL